MQIFLVLRWDSLDFGKESWMHRSPDYYTDVNLHVVCFLGFPDYYMRNISNNEMCIQAKLIKYIIFNTFEKYQAIVILVI